MTLSNLSELPLQGMSMALDARSLHNPAIGVSRYAMGLIDSLINNGADVTLITDQKLKLESRHAHLPVVLLAERRRFKWEQQALRHHLDENNYDAFIAPNNMGLPLLYRGNTNLFLVVHDLIPIIFWRQYLLPDLKKTARHLLAQFIAVRKARRVFTVSAASQRSIERFYRRRAVIAPPAIAPMTSDVSAADIESPYFLYAGGYDRRKNASQVVRAFAMLHATTPRAQLVMTGNPTTEVLDEIRSSNAESRIVLSGVVSEEEKWALLKGAVACVYPSQYEGFGLPLVESFQAGTPIITTDKGALREVGGPATILVDPASPDDIAAKMELCLDDAYRSHYVTLGNRQLEDIRKSMQNDVFIETLSALREVDIREGSKTSAISTESD